MMKRRQQPWLKVISRNSSTGTLVLTSTKESSVACQVEKLPEENTAENLGLFLNFVLENVTKKEKQ